MKTIEEILEPLWDYVPDQLIGAIDDALEEFVKQEKKAAVHQALDEAAEKAMVVETDVNKEVWAKDKQLIDLDGHRYRVDKESILSLKEKY